MSIQQIGTKFYGYFINNKNKLKKKYHAVFKCDECGINFITSLKSCKKIKSCGCLRDKNNGERAFKHGFSYGKTYASWHAMIMRCSENNKNDPHLYVDRGITVCQEWLDIENFIKDMGERPKGLTLDRIDNNKGYCKENCRWANNKEQGRNRRNNKILTIDGISKTVMEWSEHEGVTTNYNNIYKRLEKGWDHKSAVFAKTRSKPLLTINGITKCIADWVVHEGVTVGPKTILYRLRHGWEPERAVFEKPYDKRLAVIENSESQE